VFNIHILGGWHWKLGLREEEEKWGVRIGGRGDSSRMVVGAVIMSRYRLIRHDRFEGCMGIG